MTSEGALCAQRILEILKGRGCEMSNEIKLPPLPDGVAFIVEYGGDVYAAETVERLRREAIESSGLQAEVERLTAENAELRKTLLRYVKEVPLGNQPPMLAEVAYKQAMKETP